MNITHDKTLCFLPGTNCNQNGKASYQPGHRGMVTYYTLLSFFSKKKSWSCGLLFLELAKCQDNNFQELDLNSDKACPKPHCKNMK